MKKSWIFLLALLLMSTLAACAAKASPELTDVMMKLLAGRDELQRARVTAVLSDGTERFEDMDPPRTVRTLTFTAALLSGDYRGYSFQGRQVLDSMSGYQPRPVSEGSRVFVYMTADDAGSVTADFSEYDRVPAMLWLTAAFALALLVFGRTKGLRALVALVVTCAAIFFFFLPYVKNGGSPIWSSVVVCLFVTLMTNLLIGGWSVKCLSATLGCLCGVLASGVLAGLMQEVMKLTGLADDHSLMLAYSSGGHMDMNGLMFASVIIGAIGAAMDVGISIASALEELASKAVMTPLELTRSGLRIGRDIMGTMANTLILAYVGGALTLMMLITFHTSELSYVLSWEQISIEFVRSIAGSMGLIVTVPATAMLSGWLYGRKKKPLPPEPEINPFA